MANPNEISSLQRIMVKPLAWRMVEHADGEFSLDFTYVEPARLEWAEVMTRRGGRKFYKTANAALRDIARVQSEAVIYSFLQA